MGRTEVCQLSTRPRTTPDRHDATAPPGGTRVPGPKYRSGTGMRDRRHLRAGTVERPERGGRRLESPWRELPRWARRMRWPRRDVEVCGAIAALGVAGDHTVLFLGRCELAAGLGMSDGAVARSLARLVVAGALVVVEQTRGGRRTASSYRLGDLERAAGPPLGRWRQCDSPESHSHLPGGVCSQVRQCDSSESPTPSLRSGDPVPVSGGVATPPPARAGADARTGVAGPAAPCREAPSSDRLPGAGGGPTAAPPDVAEGVGGPAAGDLTAALAAVRAIAERGAQDVRRRELERRRRWGDEARIGDLIAELGGLAEPLVNHPPAGRRDDP